MKSMSGAHTKRKLGPSADLEDKLRPHYDTSLLNNGVRGKYPIEYQKLQTGGENKAKIDERF